MDSGSREDSVNGCCNGPESGERKSGAQDAASRVLVSVLSWTPESRSFSWPLLSRDNCTHLTFPGNSLPIDLQLIFSFLSEPLTVLAGKGWQGARDGFNQQLGPH